MAGISNSSCAEPNCKQDGKYSCGNCKLVSYCGKLCQVAHWPKHKSICKSALMRTNWRPCWENESRMPSFAKPRPQGNPHNPFGEGKYLWGNVPAIDVINLVQNEGSDFAGDIALLFAASGDLRNVVKTIAQIPEAFKQQIEVTLNDREFHVVARNAILLLFSLTALEETTAETPGVFKSAESLLHLWYSASLPSDIVSQLVSRVKPLIADVCGQISPKAAGAMVEKTWFFSQGRSLRLAVKKEDWFRLEALCDVPSDLTRQKAHDIRIAITLAPERRDYRDRWYFKDATPSVRVSKQKFREDGLLLPFGHNRVGFDIPNPTFYLPPFVWPMDDKADPLDGWPILEVVRIRTLAREDLYGKLHIYLQAVFQRFLDRLATVKVAFELLNIDAIQLPQALQERKYTRIEVSNITDAGYVGTRETLRLLSPLLQPPHENAHATIISTYLNAIMEMVNLGDEEDKTPDTDLLMKYLPEIEIFSLLRPESADSLKVWDARKTVLDRDKSFERYTRLFQFDRICADLNVAMKGLNTVAEAWPTKPRLRLGQEEAQDEFNILLGSNYSCVERFVEWRRTK
ncbi:hypothetical protein BDW59DRAFT_177240 [Aspergillus cavernicola]|uniref:MYND-type domain-containing protein n=1 Tax=Aspergillus cavernicola TaxID=176166 RepID=A0ABR4J5S0_9EURO